MPHIGVTELVVILLIVIVLFGATRLPQIGRGLGEGIRNFKKGIRQAGEDDEPVAPAPGKNDARS